METKEKKLGKKAVVVFSGGQDSTTCLGWAKNRFDEVHAISFSYNQKHSIEIEQAKIITTILGIDITIHDLKNFGDMVDSALTHNGDVNKKHPRLSDLPASFVPNRNTLFLTLAHAFAQKIGATDLVTGVCQTDYSGYPDCREEFIKALEKTLNLGSNSDIAINTPLMEKTKAETFKMARDEGVLDIVIDYSHTCYNGDRTINEWGSGCGNCPACKLREKGWKEYIEKIEKGWNK